MWPGSPDGGWENSGIKNLKILSFDEDKKEWKKVGKRWENTVIHLQLFSTLSATDFPTGQDISKTKASDDQKQHCR